MKRVAKWTVGIIGVLLLIGLAIGSTVPTVPPLSAGQRQAVSKAFSEKAWIEPNTLTVNDTGVVVADFEIPPDFLIPPKALAQSRLLLIRETLLPDGYKDYRVDINGPPPGTGLVQRYGSARLFEGGSLNWDTP